MGMDRGLGIRCECDRWRGGEMGVLSRLSRALHCQQQRGRFRTPKVVRKKDLFLIYGCRRWIRLARLVTLPIDISPASQPGTNYLQLADMNVARLQLLGPGSKIAGAPFVAIGQGFQDFSCLVQVIGNTETTFLLHQARCLS